MTTTSLTFAEAAKQRADKRFKIEIDGMPALFVRRLSVRENRLLRESCLCDGAVDVSDPDALDGEAYSFALLAAVCQNEDGSAAFAGGEEELLGFDELLIGQLIKEVVQVATVAGDSGNA